MQEYKRKNVCKDITNCINLENSWDDRRLPFGLGTDWTKLTKLRFASFDPPSVLKLLDLDRIVACLESSPDWISQTPSLSENFGRLSDYRPLIGARLASTTQSLEL